MTLSRTTVKRVIQLAALIAVAALAAQPLRSQWSTFSAAAGAIRPRAMPLIASCLAVFAVYAVQIHSWRTLVSAWGRRLPFLDAARIWTLSNLARYTPAGIVASTGTLAILGNRAGVPAAAAAGAAILGTLLNLLAGFVVVVGVGAPLLPLLWARIGPSLVPWIGLAAAIALIALPLAIRPLATVAGRFLRRPIELPPMPARVLVTAVTANIAAWFLYGLAFRWLALSLFPTARGSWLAYTAVYTGGYLAGLLAVLLPAGLGVREFVLGAALAKVGLFPDAEAAVLVVASRLLMTALEIVPGAVFLAYGASRRTPERSDASFR